MFASHNPYLIALSVVVAILGGYTGFGLASRVRGTSGAGRRTLFAGAAAFLALGIWTMHFVGTLAAPIPGDAFMTTAGLFERLPDPILTSLRCGMEMVKPSRRIEPDWEVRVGVQFGPVVAGIIGKRQFVFDLWGDTVNVAARIAAQASPASVVTSGATWQRIRDRGRGRSLGFVNVKGKGRIELIECQEIY